MVCLHYFAAGTFRGDFAGVFVLGVLGEAIVEDEVEDEDEDEDEEGTESTSDALDCDMRLLADGILPIGHGGTVGTASVLSHRCTRSLGTGVGAFLRIDPTVMRCVPSDAAVLRSDATHSAASKPPSRTGDSWRTSRSSHRYLNWLKSQDCRANTAVY